MTCDSCSTARTSPDTPNALVAACAPLLGFQPQDCLVAFVGGVPGRSAPVLIRLDLGSERDSQSRAAALTRAVLGTGGEQVSVVAWVCADPSAPTAALPSDPVLGHLARQLRAGGVGVSWLISTNGVVWWSHGCVGSRCSWQSRPLDAAFMAAAQAEYVFAGYAPLAGRDALAERIAPEPVRCAAVDDIYAPPEGHTVGTRWREQEIDFLTGLLAPGAPPGSAATGPDRGAVGSPLTPGQVARVLRGLSDIVVRDVIVHRLAGAEPEPPRPWARTESVLCDVVRSTPAGLGAAAATLLAVVAWLGGDGALANVALDRAWDDDPRYRLATLTRRLIDSGMDPQTWRGALRSMPERRCWAGS